MSDNLQSHSYGVNELFIRLEGWLDPKGNVSKQGPPT